MAAGSHHFVIMEDGNPICIFEGTYGEVDTYCKEIYAKRNAKTSLPDNKIFYNFMLEKHIQYKPVQKITGICEDEQKTSISSES